MATKKQITLARKALAAGEAWLAAQEAGRAAQEAWYKANNAAAAAGVQMEHVYGRRDRNGHSPLVGFKATVPEQIS